MGVLCLRWAGFTIFSFLLNMACASDPCHPCKCLGTSADCSYRNLTQVPDIPTDNLKSLSLNHNALTTVRDGELRNFSLLEIVDLSVNRLSRLHNKSFDGLSNLRELYLNVNQLKYLPEVFPLQVFQPLPRLQRLWLQNNIDTDHHDNQTYPDQALSALTSLVELRLDGLKVMHLGQGFLRMRNMSSLSLSSQHCLTTALTNSSFGNVPRLTYLSVADCRLIHIETDAFAPLRELREVNMSYNSNLTLDRAGAALYGVRQSRLTTLDISAVEYKFAIGVVVRESYIRYLTNLPLRVLLITYNRVRLLEPLVPSLLPKTLKVFSLSGNDLTYGDYIRQLPKMTSVREFNCSFQGISHVPPTLEKLMEVSVDGEIHAIPVPPNTTVLDVSHSHYHFRIPVFRFTANVLQTLNMSHCIFFGWKGSLEGLQDLETLDLSYNYCDQVNPCFFQNLTALKTLDVSHNLLGSTLLDTQGQLFSAQKSLRILRMGDNKIRQLPYDVFNGLDSIEQLYLDCNDLDSFNVSIAHMKSLHLLDLRNNFLVQVPLDVLNQLDSLAPKGHPNLTLKLANNSLHCTCNELDFWKWLENRTSAVEVLGVRNTSCLDASSTKRQFQDYDEVVSHLDSVCAHHAILFFGILAATVCFLTLLVAALCYRYRWKLRYLYYMATWKKRETCADQQDFRYDAFISYANEDHRFVLTDMRRRLEKEAGLRLCMHNIHFQPGIQIAENILQAVSQSRKTVVLLSPDFLDSYWCNFEVQMAQMEEVFGQRQVLLVVLYRSVNMRHLSRTLLHVLRRDSYLEYPCDPSRPGDPPDPRSLDVFWHRLKSALVDEDSSQP